MRVVKVRLVRMLECPAMSFDMLPNSHCKNCQHFGGERFTYGCGVNETKEIRCLYPLRKRG